MLCVTLHEQGQKTKETNKTTRISVGTKKAVQRRESRECPDAYASNPSEVGHGYVQDTHTERSACRVQQECIIRHVSYIHRTQ